MVIGFVSEINGAIADTILYEILFDFGYRVTKRLLLLLLVF